MITKNSNKLNKNYKVMMNSYKYNIINVLGKVTR